MYFFFFFKQKTAYEMRISDWSSDVCSSDLEQALGRDEHRRDVERRGAFLLGEFERVKHTEPVDDAVGELGRDDLRAQPVFVDRAGEFLAHRRRESCVQIALHFVRASEVAAFDRILERELGGRDQRSEEHTSE